MRYIKRNVAWSTVALLISISASLAGEVTMKIDAPLSKVMEYVRDNDQEIPVIITLERREDLDSLVMKGIKPRMVYQNISAVAAAITPSQIRDVAQMPQVKAIELDSEAKALTKP